MHDHIIITCIRCVNLRVSKPREESYRDDTVPGEAPAFPFPFAVDDFGALAFFTFPLSAPMVLLPLDAALVFFDDLGGFDDIFIPSETGINNPLTNMDIARKFCKNFDSGTEI